MPHLWRVLGRQGEVLECFSRKTRYRQMKTLQKFSAVHAAFHNHFNQDRHLIISKTQKAQRSATPTEWKMIAT